MHDSNSTLWDSDSSTCELAGMWAANRAADSAGQSGNGIYETMECLMQAMRDIVAKCLVKDPTKRPSATQLLDHKFFKVCRPTVSISRCL